MGIFKLKQNLCQKEMDLASVKAPTAETLKGEAKAQEEEWIWVEGYKATDKDMKCRDYHFDFNQIFDIGDDKLIMCAKGFHLCPKLHSCFSYYSIGEGNRFFKVRALINKNMTVVVKGSWLSDSVLVNMYEKSEKWVAKKIEFIEECSPDEIFKAASGRFVYALNQDDKFKDEVLKFNLDVAYQNQQKYRLRAFSIYTDETIEIIVAQKRTELAVALAKEPISHDTRMLILFK